MSCSHTDRSKQDKEGSDAGWSGLVARGGVLGLPKTAAKLYVNLVREELGF